MYESVNVTIISFIFHKSDLFWHIKKKAITEKDRRMYKKCSSQIHNKLLGLQTKHKMWRKTDFAHHPEHIVFTGKYGGGSSTLLRVESEMDEA